jgi:hypothetical protein
MKIILRLAVLLTLATCIGTAFGSTWWVRPDGGYRHSSIVTWGMCNGTADVSYVAAGGVAGEFWQAGQTETLGTTVYIPGGKLATVTTAGTSGSGITWPGSGTVSGTGGSAVYTVGSSTFPSNLNCAFLTANMLWQDGSYADGGSTFPAYGWIGSGGDTYIIRGSIADGVSYRIGWPNNTLSCISDDNSFCWGLHGDQSGSGMPPPPNGSAGAHTVLEGGNFAACTNQTARTQLHGGWGVGAVMSLYNASYVDAKCLDLTDYSACGSQNASVACKDGGGAVISDYSKQGIFMGGSVMHDVSLTDIRIHGVASDGINGPPGANFTMTDIAILGNQDAGWNADNGSGTTGVGATNVTNFNISWNGCAEEYPIADPIPYGDCRDQSTGGYGDGFGTTTVTSPPPGWQVHFDQGIVSYNMQDGLDALHIYGTGSSIAVTRTLAFANEGQQLKVGGSPATIQNSIIVGNCYAVLQNTIPGRPIPTLDNLANACRAGNTAVFVTVQPGAVTKFQDNTLFSAGDVGFEVEYATGDTGSTNVLQYNNITFVGFVNPDNGQNPTPIYSNTDLNMLTNSGASWTNNSYFGYRDNWTCPNASESNALCSNPLLVDMAWHPYGYGNMAPASGASPVVGAGVTIAGIPTDYNGATRPNPPSIGAYEFGTAPAPATGLGTGILFGGHISIMQ